jgi:uncharacterized membrane protein YsdA (DUF1294 family)
MSDSRHTSPSLIFLVVAGVIVAVAVAAAFYYSVPWPIGLLGGINLATVALYGYDKAIAGGRKLRVPESVLHWMAFLGGSPAALLSQSLFRHKTVKPSFRRMFWLIVVLQLALLVGAGWWWWTHRTA